MVNRGTNKCERTPLLAMIALSLSLSLSLSLYLSLARSLIEARAHLLNRNPPSKYA